MLHCCFNLNHLPVPEETPGLLTLMFVAFNRAGEDASLAFRKRAKANYNVSQDIEDPDNESIFEEEIFERIDSNILYAFYAYLSRDEDHI